MTDYSFNEHKSDEETVGRFLKNGAEKVLDKIVLWGYNNRKGIGTAMVLSGIYAFYHASQTPADQDTFQVWSNYYLGAGKANFITPQAAKSANDAAAIACYVKNIIGHIWNNKLIYTGTIIGGGCLENLLRKISQIKIKNIKTNKIENNKKRHYGIMEQEAREKLFNLIYGPMNSRDLVKALQECKEAQIMDRILYLDSLANTPI